MAVGVPGGNELVAVAGITAQGGLIVALWDASAKQSSEEYAVDAQLVTADGQTMHVRKIFAGAKSASAKSAYKFRCNSALWGPLPHLHIAASLAITQCARTCKHSTSPNFGVVKFGEHSVSQVSHCRHKI